MSLKFVKSVAKKNIQMISMLMGLGLDLNVKTVLITNKVYI
jgi:hypothetical protein|tara:strand:- start:105 stop:227 length:123 start_codon:yes stop_codon:yes gene_type:complete